MLMISTYPQHFPIEEVKEQMLKEFCRNEKSRGLPVFQVSSALCCTKLDLRTLKGD